MLVLSADGRAAKVLEGHFNKTVKEEIEEEVKVTSFKHFFCIY